MQGFGGVRASETQPRSRGMGESAVMLTLTPAGLHITVARPMGYSDHFGLRRIAEDQAHADRLVGALKASGGSLALSWLNLGEYATVTDREQRLQAERLIDRVLPAVFPLDVAPFEVHRRQIAAGPHPPHADEAVAIILTKTIESVIAASGVEVRLTASGVFDPLNHERLIASKERLARITHEKLEGLRKEYATNPDFRRAVMRADRTPETASETNVLAITRAMTATFLPDLKRPITLNDAIDWQHAIVPLAFCDAVLLDGATAHAAKQVRRKLPDIPMALVFTGGGDGIDRFIEALAERRRP